MHAISEWLAIFVEEPMKLTAEVGMLIFEWIGVILLVAAAVMGVINYIKGEPSTRLKLAKNLSAGLEFLMGAEILRTLLVRDIKELAIVGGITALRAALGFLTMVEEKNLAEHGKKHD